MSYAIFRIEKFKNSNAIKASELHNERKFKNSSNLDIDREKTKFNYDLVSSENYLQDINEKIQKNYIGEKKIRKDAIKACEVIITSDKNFFARIGAEKTKEYFEKSLEFLKKEFGENNIISAKVHLDEETPHLHAIFTPIVDGRLCAKQILGNQVEFKARQSRFFAHMSPNFDLERGKPSEMTLARHKTVKELKNENLKELMKIEKKLKEKKKELLHVEEFFKWKEENPEPMTKLEREFIEIENEQNQIIIKDYYDLVDAIDENFIKLTQLIENKDLIDKIREFYVSMPDEKRYDDNKMCDLQEELNKKEEEIEQENQKEQQRLEKLKPTKSKSMSFGM